MKKTPATSSPSPGKASSQPPHHTTPSSPHEPGDVHCGAQVYNRGTGKQNNVLVWAPQGNCSTKKATQNSDKTDGHRAKVTWKSGRTAGSSSEPAAPERSHLDSRQPHFCVNGQRKARRHHGRCRPGRGGGLWASGLPGTPTRMVPSVLLESKKDFKNVPGGNVAAILQAPKTRLRGNRQKEKKKKDIVCFP